MIQTIKDKFKNEVVAGDLVTVPELQENDHIALPLYMVMQVHEGKLTVYNISTKRVRTVLYPQTDFVTIDPCQIEESLWYDLATDIEKANAFLQSKHIL